MEDYWETLLGSIWVLVGSLTLFLGWSSQSYASAFRTSLSVTMGVLLLLGGSALVLHARGFGQDE